MSEQTALAEVRALRRAIDRAEGFQLIVVVCNRAEDRTTYLNRLAMGPPEIEFYLIDLAKRSEDLFAAACRNIAIKPLPIVVTGLEARIDRHTSDFAQLRQLNLDRPRWIEEVPVPVLLFVTEALLPSLAEHAPDFMGYRADTIFLPELHLTDPRSFEASGYWMQQTNSTVEEKAARIQELGRRLSETDADSDAVSNSWRLRWLIELVALLNQIGDSNNALELIDGSLLPLVEFVADHKARAVALSLKASTLAELGRLHEAIELLEHRVLPLVEKHGGARERVLAVEDLAELKFRIGRRDEALRIYRNSVFPILKSLANPRDLALSKAKYARMLADKGDSDRAMSILREEVLPVLQNLADKRATAVTYGHLSDILQSRGDYEGANQLRLTEEVPVYLKLGELRELAVTWLRIADACAAKGDPLEALRIYEKHMAPALLGRVDSPPLAEVQARVSRLRAIASAC